MWFNPDTKTIAIALGIGFLAQFAVGQGQLRFFNNSQTLISTNSVVGGPATGPTDVAADGYFYGLFMAPSGTTNPDNFAFTGFYATNVTAAGRMSGDQITLPLPPGSTVSFIVRGWSSNIGTTVSSVTNYLASPTFDAWYGQSPISTIILGGGAVSVPNLFGIAAGQTPGFTLEMYSVPEPSALSLFLLGVFAARSCRSNEKRA